MPILMQAFYWDCPKLDNQDFEWWNFVATKVPSLHNTGFTALWLPPCNKAAESISMGYDPYDYYDLGEFNQKGSVKTWFGSKEALAALIDTLHANGMQAIADFVINHNSGGDADGINPLTGATRWTKFTPLSEQFNRDADCFHPSSFERWDGGEFGDMPDLCHRNPYVYSQIMELARWMIEEVGFDGLRYDFVKGYGGWMVKSILERLYSKPGNGSYSPFGVGECWSDEISIDEWLGEVNNLSDNPGSAFDFPLRDRLKSLCDSWGYSLKELAKSGTMLTDNPALAVTFVENHDIVRVNPIVNDKILAYAFILTHDGYPCVFWQDYYNWNLAQENLPTGIAALVKLNAEYAAGATTVLCGDDDNLYIMQRSGAGNLKGLVFVLNNLGSWNGKAVQTQWINTRFVPLAWRDNPDGAPEEKWSDENGYLDCWAPARGYAVYVPV